MPAAAKRAKPAAAKKSLELPSVAQAEIASVASRAGRSTAFVVRRALAAAAKLPPAAAATGPTAPLALAVDEDDAADTLVRVAELLAARGGEPGGALASAWASTRGQFLAWLERLEEADRAARADDLDAALEEAARPGTSPERLRLLAGHEYVQVRARVAGNPSSPPDALERLAAERERTVRARLRGNPSLPAALRAGLEE